MLAIIRRWWVWILAVIVLAFGARFASSFPWQDTWESILEANWGLLGLASAANLLSFAAKGVAWHLLLVTMAPVRFRSTQAATFAGAAVNAVSIAVSGEAARMHLVTTYDGVPAMAAARSILASRFVEAAALGLLLMALGVGGSLWPGWYLGAAGAVLAIGAILILWRSRLVGSANRSPAGPAGLPLSDLVLPILVAGIAWLLQWAGYHWAIAATGVPLNPEHSVTAVVLSNIGGLLRLTPGNVGVLQGAVVLALRPLHVPGSQAVAAGLALQAVQVFPILAVGLLLLGRHGLRELLRGSATEPV
ncbi:MAG TPA: lysylphosphatidylglycerol synthase transmembrane domain-containing protein [Chloroflexota bacterium]|nr:lysylphosphatidylglycerol synthase transmembrane domain-containing protein [Chloroflexota bacterium]